MSSKKFAGFTLIEVLVVLSIMGIMLGLLVVKYGKDERQTLQLEAHRLSLLLSHATNTARTTGQPIAWQGNERGYHFLQYFPISKRWQKLGVTNGQSDTSLRERQLPEDFFLSDVKITGTASSTNNEEYEMIIFSPSGINPAFNLTLKSPQAKVEVKGNMLGLVEDLPAVDLP